MPIIVIIYKLYLNYNNQVYPVGRASYVLVHSVSFYINIFYIINTSNVSVQISFEGKTNFYIGNKQL